jgi:osmotically inducible protein OsmC
MAMTASPKMLYIAEAIPIGPREGHARTTNSRVDVDLDIPREMGGNGGQRPLT